MGKDSTAAGSAMWSRREDEATLRQRRIVHASRCYVLVLLASSAQHRGYYVYNLRNYLQEPAVVLRI